MKIRKLYRETHVNKPIDEVFDFFINPENMIKVTPKNLSVKILNKEPIEMKEGEIIKLRMKLFGLFPVKWETKIDEINPPVSFVDTQPKGPYRYWKHTHRFVEKNNGTLIIDQVEYAVPGYLFEPIIHFIFVKRSLNKLFDYRQQRYKELLN